MQLSEVEALKCKDYLVQCTFSCCQGRLAVIYNHTCFHLEEGEISLDDTNFPNTTINKDQDVINK